MSIFGLCGAMLCFSVIFYWTKVSSEVPPAVAPYAHMAGLSGLLKSPGRTTPLSQVSDDGLTGTAPREAATVKQELIKALRMVEELKAELSTLESLKQVLANKPEQIIAIRQG